MQSIRLFLLIILLNTSCRNNARIIMTVTGPVPASEAGIMLPHEHIIVDFIGADSIQPGRYNSDSVINIAMPFLKELNEQSCKTFVDGTPDFLGRDVKLLEKLSKATGINIVTNTGYYGAVKHKFLPQYVSVESAEQIAARWIKEFENGIDGTVIKPGFIKLSADEGPLSSLQRKTIEAGAITHLKTGLPIAVHSGDGNAAKEELSILMQKNVLPDAYIWVHAQNEKDNHVFKEMAGKGAWVEFDGLSNDNVDQYVSFLKYMKQNNLLHRTLVSHDAGYYTVGIPNGGNFRTYTTLFTHLIPALKREGFTDTEIDLLIITNPAKAYAIKGN